MEFISVLLIMIILGMTRTTTWADISAPAAFSIGIRMATARKDASNLTSQFFDFSMAGACGQTANRLGRPSLRFGLNQDKTSTKVSRPSLRNRLNQDTISRIIGRGSVRNRESREKTWSWIDKPSHNNRVACMRTRRRTGPPRHNLQQPQQSPTSANYDCGQSSTTIDAPNLRDEGPNFSNSFAEGQTLKRSVAPRFVE